MLYRNSLAVLLTVGLMACNNGGTDDKSSDTDATDGDTDTTPTCQSGISETFPDNAATDVFYRTPIEVVFNDDESTTSTLTLASADGDVEGTTTYSEDGTTAFFTPAADLAAETQYTLTAAYSCDKVAEIVFTTGVAGAAVTGDDVLNKVYNIDIASGRITEPPGVGSLLLPLITEQDFNLLISPTALDGDDLTFLGALGVDDGGNIVQDVCTESIQFPIAGDFSENPYVAVSGDDVPINVSGFELVLAEINLSGAFAPGGSSIEGLALSGFADTALLGPLLDLGEGPDAVCDLITTFGVTCTDCGDGSMTCLELAIDSMTADLQTGSLVEIALEDIDPVACAE